MEKIVIVGYGRSPIGKLGGIFKNTSSVDIATTVLEGIINKINIKKELIDEVIIGSVLQAGNGQNIARQIALKSGLNNNVIAYTVNQVCGSGLKAIELGYNSLILGKSNIVVVGGTENMTQAPYLSKNMRMGNKLGNIQLEDSIITDGLTDAMNNISMGIIAENLAKKYNFTQKELDEIAYNSQKKTIEAINNNSFKDSIIPFNIKGNIYTEDEYPRKDISIEKLNKLKSAFVENGVVTAGNSSGINDGASILILTTEKRAKELNLDILYEIIDIQSVGVDPKDMAEAPIYSTEKILNKNNINISELDEIELNEAFASQVLAYLKYFKLSYENINTNGGAISLGHPIGMSGTRIVSTLINNLELSKGKLGLASLCVGGGIGISILIKKYGVK